MEGLASLGTVISSKVFAAGTADLGLFLCPSMDLVALASSSSALLLRLSWQRLLQSTPPGGVVAAAWTPSGRALSLLCATGELRLVPAEASEEERVTRGTGSGPASFVSWSRAVLDGERMERLRGGGGEKKEKKGRGETKGGEWASPELALVVADSAVELWQGPSRLARVACEGVWAAWLAPGHAQMVAVCRRGETASVKVLSTPRLAERLHEFSALAVLDESLRAGLERVKAKTAELRTAWKAVFESVVALLQKLQQRLQENGSSETLDETLLDLLLCGARVDGTIVWLDSDVGEKHAAKLVETVAAGGKTAIEQIRALGSEVAELAERAEQLRELCARDQDGFAGLFERAIGVESPYTSLVAHCVRLDGVFRKTAVADMERMHEPVMAFCNWLWRGQKLSQFEEAVAAGDDVRRKELQDELNKQRASAVLNERIVAKFMQSPTLDECSQLLETLELEISAGLTMLDQALLGLSDGGKGCTSHTVMDLPAETLRGADFYSNGLSSALLLDRQDDLAIFSWDDMSQPKGHQVSLYNAAEGEIVGAEFYKDGTMLVLAYDADSDTTYLSLVENGDEIKMRTFKGAADRLGVSKDRGLAAVRVKNTITLIDVENTEEDEEGEAEAGGGEVAENN